MFPTAAEIIGFSCAVLPFVYCGATMWDISRYTEQTIKDEPKGGDRFGVYTGFRSRRRNLRDRSAAD